MHLRCRADTKRGTADGDLVKLKNALLKQCEKVDDMSRAHMHVTVRGSLEMHLWSMHM